MRNATFTTALMLAAVSLPATAQLTGIDILPSPPDVSHSFPGWRMEAPLPSGVDFELALGDDLTGQIVRLDLSSVGESEFRVQVQFETSLTLMDGGPHLDLRAWEHCTSDWRDTYHLSTYEFRIPGPTENDFTCFPPVTPAEIQAAVRHEGGERWSELVQGIRGPRDYPLGVSLSTTRLRIQVNEGGGVWSNIAVINIRIPMGC